MSSLRMMIELARHPVQRKRLRLRGGVEESIGTVRPLPSRARARKTRRQHASRTASTSSLARNVIHSTFGLRRPSKVEARWSSLARDLEREDDERCTGYEPLQGRHERVACGSPPLARFRRAPAVVRAEESLVQSASRMASCWSRSSRQAREILPRKSTYAWMRSMSPRSREENLIGDVLKFAPAPPPPPPPHVRNHIMSHSDQLSKTPL
jgi:hypothetical protein